MTEKLNVLAIDDGYGDTKFTNGNKPFHIPSFATEYVQAYKNEMGMLKTKTFDNLVVEVDGFKYYVGKSAIQNNTEIEWEGSDNKHKSPYFPILLKTVLGLLLQNEKSKVDMLVWGLPVKADEDKERHELLRKVILQPHEVKISVNGQAFEHKEITIENLIIKKQPFGSLCDIILDKNGKIIHQDIAKGFNVIADIGARTFNLYTLDGLQPRTDLSTHTNQGMYKAYQGVGKWIEQSLKLKNPIPDGQLKEMIDRKEIQNVSLVKATDIAYQQLANSIKNTIKKRYIDTWGFVDRIIFTGGGSELLKPYLQDEFGDKAEFLGRYNTVMGLQKYGHFELNKLQYQQKDKVVGEE